MPNRKLEKLRRSPRGSRTNAAEVPSAIRADQSPSRRRIAGALLLLCATMLFVAAFWHAIDHRPEAAFELRQFQWFDAHCWFAHCSHWNQTQEATFDFSSFIPVAVASNGVVAGVEGKTPSWFTGPLLRNFIVSKDTLEEDIPATPTAIAVEPTGHVLLGYQNGAVRTWIQQETSTRLLMTLENGAQIVAAAVNITTQEEPDSTVSRRAIVADSEGTLYDFDPDQPTVIKKYTAAVDRVTALAFHADGGIIVGYRGGQLLLRSPNGRYKIIGPAQQIEEWMARRGHGFSGLRFGLRGFGAATIFPQDTNAPLWDSRLPDTLPPPSRQVSGAITAVASGPKRSVIAGYWDGQIVHWTGDGKLAATYGGHTATVLALSNFEGNPDLRESFYQSVGRDNSFRVWRLIVIPPVSAWVVAFLSVMSIGVFLLTVTRRWAKPADIDAKGALDLDVDLPLTNHQSATPSLSARANQLARFLTNPDSVGPFTIAVTGEWGSGKSSLMQLVAGDLLRTGHPCIWFNAWHHQNEPHMFAALMETIRSFRNSGVLFTPNLRQRSSYVCERLAFRMHLATLRLRRRPIATVAYLILLCCLFFIMFWLPAILMANAPAWTSETIQNVVRGTTGLAAILLSVTKLNPFRIFSRSARTLTQQPTVWTRFPRFSDDLSFRYLFAREFSDVCDAFGHRHLVIVIDDLDRCKPAQCVEILEALNFLTSNGKCFVLLGVSEQQMQAAVGLIFGDLAVEIEKGRQAIDGRDSRGETLSSELGRRARSLYAREYLDKVVDMYVSVPPVEYEEWKTLHTATRRQGRT